ncbi:Os04g0546100 [Oryza sativa Japonica Group]|uniref:Os04g0546100 protein n=1 Tax=Oryza sativa subsp. japonica TaxID=39947 RepID=A0A0P0WD03_ORYSJ|nr:protein WHAT'S THIS FACTOR 1 homolog [Oryza sativa Japonica Group]XP_015636079.1 protein WHAT'S THIS FACTOR 1 homolog [Oryza sativa Japonica Group]BAS90338.1 Os04g0546100 [Oryza sativa Japonica Group]
MQKVRLKWVKNRGLDHIIARTTSIRASCLLLDHLARLPSSSPVPARSLARLQKPLGLTVPVLRFLRRHPTLFAETLHPRFPTLPSFSLTPASDILLGRLARASALDSHLRLARLLLLTRSKSLPLASVLPLRFDLGLPYNFAAAFPVAHPDLFAVSNNHISLSATASGLPEGIAISSLQRRHAEAIEGATYRALSRPPSSSIAPLAFPMRFPRGYGGMKKVKAWMDEFHRLPYISPYDDASGIDPDSDIYEKRNIGLLHELLGLMVHKMVRRNAIRLLREELGLPHKFTRLFTRYPGVFYLSLKCKTTTVVLREGYERGKLVEQHPLAAVRDKVFYVMRTGVLFRGKGLSKLVLDEDGDEEVVMDGDEEFHGEGMDEDADVECFGMDIGGYEDNTDDEDNERDMYD